ncbi:flagellar protein FlaG [uncultured Selenomonas sp.]|uniref:flagellar protein FlaG n=1 Tax=uncultured Selenomonas sp. TaxID=159275 RepID=UPI002584DEBC|nr:flagellar protein FlaG [uncultured Selenomonas sp.]
MAVGSVQDVMLAAVAVSSMQDGQSAPQTAGSDPAQESVVPASSNTNSVQYDAAQKANEKSAHHEKLSEDQTAYITKKLNEIMRSINVNLEFQYHKEVNVMSVRMLDKKTGEVLREVPPEAMVEHMIKVHDWIGAFLDKTA